MHRHAFEFRASPRNSKDWAGEQKPIMRSIRPVVPIALQKTISPVVGRCSMWRWKYHRPRSRSLGFCSAVARAPRGLWCSLKRSIAPPLPAASRPSSRTMMRWPVSSPNAASSEVGFAASFPGFVFRSVQPDALGIVRTQRRAGAVLVGVALRIFRCDGRVAVGAFWRPCAAVCAGCGVAVVRGCGGLHERVTRMRGSRDDGRARHPGPPECGAGCRFHRPRALPSRL